MAHRGTGTVTLDASALPRQASGSTSPHNSAVALVSTTRRNRCGSQAATAASPQAATISLAGNAIANAYLSLTDMTTEYDALLAEANLVLAVQECYFGQQPPQKAAAGNGKGGAAEETKAAADEAIEVEPPSTTAADRDSSQTWTHSGSNRLKKGTSGVGKAIRADLAAVASDSTALLRRELGALSHDRLVDHCVMLHAVIQGTVRRGGFQSSPYHNTAASSRRTSVASVATPEQQHSLVFDESMLSTSTFPMVRTTHELVKSMEEDGTKLINNYVVLDELGRGSCGKVKLAFDPATSSMVAIKIVRRRASTTGFVSMQDKTAGAALEREIAVMKKLRHKNIVSLYEVIDDPDSLKLYLVMQHVDDGAIGVVHPHSFTCEAIPGPELLDYARQILAGLEYLHSHDVVHRDIKPENILISKDGQCFLADFGVSEMFEREEQVVSGIRGTRLFMAPELLQSKTIASTPGGSATSVTVAVSGRAIDMWALGVTLYALLLGKMPFTTEDEIISKGNPTLPVDLDRIWTQLLRGMLDRDARTRITAKGARAMVKEVLHLGRRTTREGAEGALWSVCAEDLNAAITPMSKGPRKAQPTLETASTAAAATVAASQNSPPPPAVLGTTDSDRDAGGFASIPVSVSFKKGDSEDPLRLMMTGQRLGGTTVGSSFADQACRSVGSRTREGSDMSGSTTLQSSPSFADSTRRVGSTPLMRPARSESLAPASLDSTAAGGGSGGGAGASPSRHWMDSPVNMTVVAERVAETHRMAQESKMKLTLLVEEQRRVESSRLALKPYPV